QKSTYAACWLIITAATVYLFLYEYTTSGEVFPSFSWHTVLKMFFFVFSYLGNPLAPFNLVDHGNDLFPGSLYIPFLLGIFGLIILLYVSFFLIQLRRMPLQTLTPYFCFSLYALFSSLMIAFGRVASFGYKEGFAVRYVTHGNLFWIGILSLVYFAWRSTSNTTEPDRGTGERKNFGKQVFIFLFLMFVSLSVVASYRSQEDFFKLRDGQESLRLHFISMREDELCPPEWPDYQIYNEALSIMRKRRLSIYRERPGERLLPGTNKQLNSAGE
ncbi:MAG: hypothetical protein WCQ99_13040, partial [Pseudomonadota bacterium]